MAAKLDPRRVFLGYLFFTLGVLLTLFQYWHLMDRGIMAPWLRQASVIVINTLAVYIGWVLVYPWHLSRDEAYAGRRHFQWIMAVSLIFCFITMLGLALALIIGPSGSSASRTISNSDPFGAPTIVIEEPKFPWSSYAIATLYMVGYGVIGVGPWIIKWLLNQFTGRSDEGGAVEVLPPKETPRPKPTKKKAYPVETRYVIGRLRKPRSRDDTKDPNDTAQD